jgi:predicted TPR repeat methyltransferase
MRFGSMLDLGCGTGLGGAAFRPFVDWLVGVDLSPAMIAQASGKGLYDRLVTAGLTDCLADEIADRAKYHLVLAADVFVYVNDLAFVIAGVSRVLAPDGLFAFTVETHSGDGAKLLPTLRYGHGEAYVRGELGDAGFAVAHLAETPVRSEKGVPVNSLVVVARPSTSQRPTASSGA